MLHYQITPTHFWEDNKRKMLKSNKNAAFVWFLKVLHTAIAYLAMYKQGKLIHTIRYIINWHHYDMKDLI